MLTPAGGIYNEATVWRPGDRLVPSEQSAADCRCCCAALADAAGHCVTRAQAARAWNPALCPAERHSAREFTATPDPPELAQADTELVTRPGSALRPGYECAPLLQDPSDRRPHRFLTCSAEDVSLTHAHTHMCAHTHAHTRVHTNAHTHTHVHTHRSGGAQWPPRRGVDSCACCPRALRPAAPAVKAGGLQRTQ